MNVLEVLEVDEWRLVALCRSGAVDMYSSDTEGMRRVCAACPARVPCLRYALRAERGLGVKHRHGMWGGRTPRERYEIDKRRRWSIQRSPIDHGSPGGATAHRRRGEDPCRPCLRAEAADTARRKARRTPTREDALSCR